MSDTPPVNKLLDFHGEIVFVTGGGRGIGAAIALRFAEAGADVVVHYHQNQAAAEQVQQRIQDMGRKAIIVQGDVGQSADVQRMTQTVMDAWGKLSVVINNAGIYPQHSLMDMHEDDWDNVINANLRSVFLMTQAAARIMQHQSDSLNAIVNIASIEGINAAPNHSHYDASKAAVLMHTRAAALELGVHGIRVNAVSPGLIWQEGIESGWPEGVNHWQANAPLERLGMGDDVADACLYLASRAARWVTGANIVVDGGMSTRGRF